MLVEGVSAVYTPKTRILVVNLTCSGRIRGYRDGVSVGVDDLRQINPWVSREFVPKSQIFFPFLLFLKRMRAKARVLFGHVKNGKSYVS